MFSVTFIPEEFHVFDNLIFLISLSSCLLLVYRSTIHFMY